jgi:hypothetical protein
MEMEEPQVSMLIIFTGCESSAYLPVLWRGVADITGRDTETLKRARRRIGIEVLFGKFAEHIANFTTESAIARLLNCSLVRAPG